MVQVFSGRTCSETWEGSHHTGSVLIHPRAPHKPHFIGLRSRRRAALWQHCTRTLGRAAGVPLGLPPLLLLSEEAPFRWPPLGSASVTSGVAEAATLYTPFVCSAGRLGACACPVLPAAALAAAGGGGAAASSASAFRRSFACTEPNPNP